jgi:hypothetical protein
MIVRLIEQGFVSQRLVDDVRMIDFTRNVLSDRRCTLLEHVPESPAADSDAESITAAVIESLESRQDRSSDENELLAALLDQDPGHRDAQLARENAFLDRCATSPHFTAEMVKVASQLRDMVRQSPLIEFRQQLPVDDLKLSPSLRLDEADCRLK